MLKVWKKTSNHWQFQVVGNSFLCGGECVASYECRLYEAENDKFCFKRYVVSVVSVSYSNFWIIRRAVKAIRVHAVWRKMQMTKDMEFGPQGRDLKVKNWIRVLRPYDSEWVADYEW